MPTKLYTNLIEIDPKIIPKELKVYTIIGLDEMESIDSFARKYVGVVIDRKINKIATVREIEGKEPENNIRFDNLPVRSQTTLVKRILEVEYNLSTYDLSKKLRKIRKPKVLNDVFTIFPETDTRVLKDNGRFYLSIHICHEVVSRKTIWEIVGKDANKLEEFLKSCPDILLKDLASKYREAYAPLEVRKVGKNAINDLYKYHEKYFSIEELKQRFGEPDYNQPIIIAKSAGRKKNKNSIHLLPQFSAIVYNAQYLEEHEAKEFLDFVRLYPNERLELLQNLLSSIEADVITKEPVTVDVETLNEATIVVRDGKKQLKPLTAYEIGKRTQSKKSIFRWIYSIFKRQHVPKENILLPFEVPELIQHLKTIPTIIVVDKNAKVDRKSCHDDIRYIINCINTIRRFGVDLPYFDYANKFKFKDWNLCNDKEFGDFLNFVKDVSKGSKISFAFIVLPEKIPDEKFDKIKRRLLELNVISQVINDSTFPLDPAKRNCILLQILSKLGIKYYALQRPFEYDYVVGLDITPTKTGASYVAGCAVMFDSQGYIRRTIPIELEDQAGEKVDAKELFEKMINLMERKYEMPITGKTMLFLKDGRFYPSEIEALNEIVGDYSINLTIMNIEKRHGFRFLSKDKTLPRRIYTKIGSDVYLLPHRLPFTKGTPIPVKLSGKMTTISGCLAEAEITKRDVEDIYCLTTINYATLYGMMKLPAPVHYAHQFVNALRKGWKVMNEEFLREGLLYFI